MKYIGKGNMALQNFINTFGTESVMSLGKFYYIPNYGYSINDIFIRKGEIIFHISCDSHMVIMTSSEINIQYGIDLDSLSIDGKRFSINLLKELLECKNLKESLFKACSPNSLMLEALKNVKNLSRIKSLSVRIKYYSSISSYEIELWFRPGITIMLMESTVTCKNLGDCFATEKNYFEIANWIENEVFK